MARPPPFWGIEAQGGPATCQLVEAGFEPRPCGSRAGTPNPHTNWLEPSSHLMKNRALCKPKISLFTQNSSKGLKCLRGRKFFPAPLGSQWSLFGFSSLPEKNHLSNKKCLSPNHPSTAGTSLSQKLQTKIMHSRRDYRAANVDKWGGRKRSWPTVLCVGIQEAWINTWW